MVQLRTSKEICYGLWWASPVLCTSPEKENCPKWIRWETVRGETLGQEVYHQVLEVFLAARLLYRKS